MGRLDGKTALITGAARGIGKATVERFVAEGAHIIAVDRSIQYVEKELVHDGLAWVEADVTDSDAIARAAERAKGFGRLDICVANAGIGRVEAFVDGDASSWLEIIRINLIGVMVTLQAAARLMVSDGKGGRLLATASIAGVHGEAMTPAYCASKGGVISLIQSLAVELAPHRITANAVAPGQIATELSNADAAVVAKREGKSGEQYIAEFVAARIPLGRRGEPWEVAAVFAFLASEEAAFISGETVRIDGAELAV